MADENEPSSKIGATGASAAEEGKDPSAQRSVVQESIEEKGENSYYYAQINENKNNAAAERVHDITKYGWADEHAKVKVYVSLPGVGELADEQVSLGWMEPGRTSRSTLDLRVDGLAGKVYGLHLQLFNRIKGVKLKKKPDKLVITLTKETPDGWDALTRRN